MPKTNSIRQRLEKKGFRVRVDERGRKIDDYESIEMYRLIQAAWNILRLN